jgi:hypothetical protein
MSKTIEAIVSQDGRVTLLENITLIHTHRALVTILDEEPKAEEITLLSQSMLATDWNNGAEAEAWSHTNTI